MNSGPGVECVLRWKAIVGESPLWDARTGRLYWVDIQSKNIHRFNPDSGRNETFTLPDLVTCVALRKTGGLLITLRKSFAFFDPDSGSFEQIAPVEANIPTNRFNDGQCDPQGRFWAGTMSEKQWDSPAGALYRLDAAKHVTTMQTRVVCANGIGWSPDGRTLYHTESFRYRIYAYDFDPDGGEISNPRVFAEVDHSTGAFPDGLTVDAEGGVWSNHVGLGRVVRYEPTGGIDRIVQFPVPRATACTFGGENLDVLYVTSARETMTAEQLRAAPLSGSLFALRPGMRGLPAVPFAG